ncbi:MAG: hypothetical protein ACOYI4_09605 [Christensenellales bacterium]
MSNLKIALVPVGALSIGDKGSEAVFEDVPLDFLKLIVYNTQNEQVGFAQLALTRTEQTAIISSQPGFYDIGVHKADTRLYMRAHIDEDGLIIVEEIANHLFSPADSNSALAASFAASGYLTGIDGKPVEAGWILLDYTSETHTVKNGSFSLGSMPLGSHALTYIDPYGQRGGSVSLFLQRGSQTKISSFRQGHYTLELSPSASALYLEAQSGPSGSLYISKIQEAPPPQQPSPSSHLFWVLGSAALLLLCLLVILFAKKRKKP